MLVLMTTLGYLCLAGGVLGQGAKHASACLRMANCTGSMSLQCGSDQRVFVMKILYGRKPYGGACSTAPSCSSCCQPDNNDCFAEYTGPDFWSVYNACLDKQNCTSQVRQGLTICADTSQSTFSVAEYVCLGSGHVTQFHVNTTVTAPAMAIHYDVNDVTYFSGATEDNQTWHCQVDTADCDQRQADVTLVKESYTSNTTSRCSRVGLSGGPFMSCVKDAQYIRVHATTPFHVSVMVDSSYKFPSGWAMVRAQGGSNLAVTCGYSGNNLHTTLGCSGKPPAETSTQSTSATVHESSTPLNVPASRSTPSTSSGVVVSKSTPSTSADVTVSMTTTSPRRVTVVKVTSSRSTALPSVTTVERTGEEGSRGVMLGVAVTGWILATVLVILLVIGAVYVHRRGGLRHQTTSISSNAARDHSQDTEHSAGVIPMEVVPHRKLPSENGDRFSHSPRPSEYVDVASSRTSSAAEYVNAASSQTGFSSAEPRPESQQEYSSLDWSRDQANSYVCLKKL